MEAPQKVQCDAKRCPASVCSAPHFSNVSYRDVAFVNPFLVRVWFFVTPITYPVSVVPEPYQTLYWRNPMVGVVEGFRWSLYAAAEGALFPWGLMAVSAGVALVLVVSGTAFFRRMER